MAAMNATNVRRYTSTWGIAPVNLVGTEGVLSAEASMRSSR